MPLVPPGYRLERGLLWPEADIGAAAVMFEGVKDLDSVYPHCRGFAVAVQAGGNCGVWPAAMGNRFEIVYSFEPDPSNFRCLAANAPAPNVFKFNAALGAEHRTVGLDLRPANCGAHQVAGDGQIPTLRIDDLGLRFCDLIYLDVEGSELAALQGAEATLAACRPVVVVEDKGLSKRYGVAVGEIETWLAARHGYRVAARLHRDVVLIP